MADARLQIALRHVQRGEELVKGQRERVTYWTGRGDHMRAERATQLLAIFKDSLALQRRSLKILQDDLGLDAEP